MLGEIDGVGEAAISALKIVRAAALRHARHELIDRPVIASWDKLVEYCTAAMAHSTIEEFRLLFLDRRNALIADEVQQHGTVDHTPLYPREVVKRALELGASAIIMVHNHMLLSEKTRLKERYFNMLGIFRPSKICVE